ncbi:MAG: tetratricopeptide repeat protein [Bacteroidota bacterium]
MATTERKRATSSTSKGNQIDWSSSNGRLLAVVIVLASAFVLYGNTLGHNYALDDVLMTENRFIDQGVQGLGAIFSNSYTTGFDPKVNESYRPLTLASFALEFQAWGENPRVSHLLNVLLYAGCGMLTLLFARQVLPDKPALLPLAVALLFMAHPIHTEVVANVKSRDELLGFLFGIGALLLLLRAHSDKLGVGRILSWAALALALLAKENTITLVAAVPLLLYFFRDYSPRQLLLHTAPYVVVAGAYLLARHQILDTLTVNSDIPAINNSLMAADDPLERLATNLVIVGKYLALLFFPHPLNWDYSYNRFPVVGFGDIYVWLTLLAYGALLAFTVRQWRKKDPVVFGILFFLITLSIASNLFVKLAATLGERFLFLPSFGFALAIPVLLSRWLAKPSQRLIYGGILGALVIAFSIKTIDRNNDWKNNITLFTSGVATHPTSAKTHLNLGIAYKQLAESAPNASTRDQNLRQALNALERSVAIYPEQDGAHYDLGVVYGMLGQREQALAAYQEALRLNPGQVDVLNNVGTILRETGREDKAQQAFDQVLAIDPNHPGALINKGVIHLDRKEYDWATQYFQQVLNKASHDKPAVNSAHYNLGVIGYNKQDFGQAFEHFRLVPPRDPNFSNASANLGSIYQQGGNLTVAIMHYQKAVQANPRNTYALNNLVVLLQQEGRTEEARQYGRMLQQLQGS